MGKQNRPPKSESGPGKRCVIYARCSTKDQDTLNQVAQLREYAVLQKWTVVEEVVDVCSGGKDAREWPGLDGVFSMAHRREFDLLLFWALDRFSREGSRKTIGYLAHLDDAGVDFHSFSEPYISSLNCAMTQRRSQSKLRT